MWRAFVYGNADFGTEELVKQSFSTFAPLDGAFDHNVVLQIKNGPMDFQIREPLHPLLGALKKVPDDARRSRSDYHALAVANRGPAARQTNVMMAVQAAQEYTGQQIHATNLVTMWSEYLDFDTRHNGPGSTIKKLLSNTSTPTSRPGKVHAGRISGMACVSNFGAYANWTGHVLAGSNSFGFGRLAWSGGSLTAEEINTEWAQLTFPATAAVAHLGNGATSSARVVETVVDILQRSRAIYEGYTSPLGLGFIVFGGGAYKAGHGACVWASPGPGDGPNGEMCPSSPGLRGAERGAPARLRPCGSAFESEPAELNS